MDSKRLGELVEEGMNYGEGIFPFIGKGLADRIDEGMLEQMKVAALSAAKTINGGYIVGGSEDEDAKRCLELDEMMGRGTKIANESGSKGVMCSIIPDDLPSNEDKESPEVVASYGSLINVFAEEYTTITKVLTQFGVSNKNNVVYDLEKLLAERKAYKEEINKKYGEAVLPQVILDEFDRLQIEFDIRTFTNPIGNHPFNTFKMDKEYIESARAERRKIRTISIQQTNADEHNPLKLDLAITNVNNGMNMFNITELTRFSTGRCYKNMGQIIDNMIIHDALIADMTCY